MKKFKTSELLNRSEMKEVQGAGYGCGGLCTTIYTDAGPTDPSQTQPIPISCKHDWVKGCGCAYGHNGAWISC